MPTVSVIIPCFNHGAFLREAIASVEEQTLTDWEIVVVDDASVDPVTQALLPTLASSRVRVIASPRNRGPGAARNLGIEGANGRYILPLDADDRIAPTYLEKACALLDEDPGLGIVYCRAEFFGLQGGEWMLPPFRLPEALWEPAIFSAAVFRKSDWLASGGYCEDLARGYEDHDFWISLLERGRHAHQIDEILFFYRRNLSSLSQSLTLEERADAYTSLFHRHRNFLTDHLPALFRAFLKREALAQAYHQRIVLQLFFAVPGGYSEIDSVRIEYGAGEWVDVMVPFHAHPRGPAPLRLDPGMHSGCYEIRALAWGDDQQIFTPLPFAEKATVAGSAIRLPHSQHLRLLSYGSDPQILLNDLVVPDVARHLRLSLRFASDLESMADSLRRLAPPPEGA